ncbi:transmembrane protein 138 [Ctenocephalides felis]|uniref:transmembrane protein 138 n=1 Tax=Ctenocephalides felis TaxID=7515 RepID=UPI000E6E3566|nr:transmembrane protein 138 [Ctenocephalides felis]
MVLTLQRFAFILFFQFVFIIVDIIINNFVFFSQVDSSTLLILYLVQDACIVLAFAALLFTFFATYIFQAGLIDLLYDRFRLTILVNMLYLILSVIIHIWILMYHWKNPKTYMWTKAFLAFYMIHRILAPIYYYLYKRTALRMSDPRFYEDIHWINEQLRTRTRY